MIKLILKVVLPLSIIVLVSSCSKENPLNVKDQSSSINTVAFTSAPQGQLAAGKDIDNKMMCFASGTDNVVYYRKQTGTTTTSLWPSNWTSMGGSSTGTIAMTKTWKDSTAIFAKNSSNFLTYNAMTKASPITWKGWTPLSTGISITSKIVAIRNANKSIVVFARASNNYLYCLTQNVNSHTFQSSWVLVGDRPIGDQITAASLYNGSIQVFVQDASTNSLLSVWQSSPNGSFVSTYEDLGAGLDCRGFISAGVNVDKGIDVFNSNPNTQMGGVDVKHRYQIMVNGQIAGWSNWITVVQYPNGGGNIDVISNADGRLEVFYPGYRNFLSHVYQTSPGGSWSTNSYIAGAASQYNACLKGVVYGDGLPGVFISTGSNIGYTYFSQSSGWVAFATFSNN
jgi:hypothetical protein